MIRHVPLKMNTSMAFKWAGSSGLYQGPGVSRAENRDLPSKWRRRHRVDLHFIGVSCVGRLDFARRELRKSRSSSVVNNRSSKDVKESHLFLSLRVSNI